MSDDPEKDLRELWTRRGVPADEQNKILAAVTQAAQPGVRVGPFTIMTEEDVLIRSAFTIIERIGTTGCGCEDPQWYRASVRWQEEFQKWRAKK